MAVLAVAPALARADTTFTFESPPLSDGTTASGQYSGIAFLAGSGALASFLPEVRVVAAGQAHSGTHVLQEAPDADELVRPAALWAFPTVAQSVSVWVRNVTTPTSLVARLQLRAFNASGSRVDGNGGTYIGVPASNSGWTELTATAPSATIAKVLLTTDPSAASQDGQRIWLDDVTAATPVTPPPADFSLNPPATASVLPGDSVDRVVTVSRLQLSSGPITYSVSGLPSGVTATFPSGGTTSSNTVPIRLTAGRGANPGSSTITITGTPSGPAVGRAPRTTSFTLTVLTPGTDVQANGLEITQGIQSIPLATQSFGRSQSAAYSGVQLVSNRTTFVRFYANAARSGGPGGVVAGVPAVLHVFDSHGELPGSPLLPDGGPRDLALGTRAVSNIERSSLANSYNFTVPASMIHGTLRFEAVVDPRPSEITECAGCQGNDAFDVTGVTFRAIQTQLVSPLRIFDTIGGGHSPNPDPFPIFDPARAAYPFPIAMLVPYQAQIDATSIINDASISDKQGALLGIVGNVVRDDNPPGNVIGIANNGVAGVTAAPTLFCCSPLRFEQFAVVNEQRPLTSVAHELGHMEGLQHASADCGGGSNGQVGTPWPPDQHGYIQGFGFDPVFHGPGGAPFIEPPGVTNTVLAPGNSPRTSLPPGAMGPLSAYVGQWFDLMSYCAQPLPDNDSWISTVNWSRLVSARSAAADRPAPAAISGVPGPALAVTALIGKQAEIVDVRPLAGGAQSSSKSPFHLVVRDAKGTVLSDTGVRSGFTHIDPGSGPAIPQNIIDAAVPAPARAASVALEDDGKLLVQRTASAHAPTVRVLAPHAGARVRAGQGVEVSWKAHDADGDKLTADVAFSANGGRNWKTVALEQPGSSVRLPAGYFTRSQRARVRVTVNDGFHSTSALSGVFRAAGNPPVATIVEPVRSVTIRADTALNLTGQAFDETAHAVAGRRLTWRLGRRILGHGPRIAAQDLPAGRQLIVLEARDAEGRVGRDSVRVRVLAVRPMFLVLRGPKSIGGHARHFTLHVGSSVLARLSAQGAKTSRRTRVGRRARSVRMTVKPGSHALKLRVALVAGRFRITAGLTIRR